MENVKLATKCPHCDNGLELNFNSWTHELKLCVPDVTPYRDKMAVVEHYKKVKGYDKVKTWDQTHRARAFGYAKALLAACAAEAVPVTAAKGAIDWASEEGRRKGLDWNLGTVVKWAPDFLKAEILKKAMVSAPRCCACTQPAVKGCAVCTDHSWCYRCDDAGRVSAKKPEEMVAVPFGHPVCKDCFKETKA